MKLAAFFSGGKDSTYSIYKQRKLGIGISCLITIEPISEESALLHYPNIKWTRLQSNAMNIPHILVKAKSYSEDSEMFDLKGALQIARKKFQITGIVHGGIKSNYQREKFENLGKHMGLEIFSPLWNASPKQYMDDLLAEKFEFIITSVAADGLDDSWLGKKITCNDLAKLELLSKRYGFNLNFEGGEAETFVTNCPMFSSSIIINKSQKVWDGYRGRFEIEEADLKNIA